MLIYRSMLTLYAVSSTVFLQYYTVYLKLVETHFCCVTNAANCLALSFSTDGAQTPSLKIFDFWIFSQLN